MTICIYDNPATFRREGWQDGHMAYSISYSLIDSIDRPELSWRCPSDGFCPGQLWGDKAAMEPQESVSTRPTLQRYIVDWLSVVDGPKTNYAKGGAK